MGDIKFSLIELSDFTKLSVRTLRRFINNGMLEGNMDSGKWLFTVEQIADFLETRDTIVSMDSKGKCSAIDWLTSMHGVPDKYFIAFTIKENEVNINKLLEMLIRKAATKMIKVHYRRCKEVIHIGIFGDRLHVYETMLGINNIRTIIQKKEV